MINNSHLQGLTTTEDIISSVDFAEQTARLLGLPLKFTAVENRLINELNLPNLYGVKRIVKPPF